MPGDARAVLHQLADRIPDALGEGLVGLYVYGSWVTGDFDDQRSDLDLLAVLGSDPTTSTVEVLTSLHRRLAEQHPSWGDRIEVEYLSRQALTDFRSDPRPMVRISPGEPLHLVRATRHYLLNWYMARQDGVPLRGADPAEVIPEIGVAEFREVVAEHAANWPLWVQDMRSPGAQAYAVLSLCRALHSIKEGGQHSKREAAGYGVAELPSWASLIRWAEGWWYRSGANSEADRLPEVCRFVQDVSDRVAAHHSERSPRCG